MTKEESKDESDKKEIRLSDDKRWNVLSAQKMKALTFLK
jgi:hypothetical protein